MLTKNVILHMDEFSEDYEFYILHKIYNYEQFATGYHH